MIRFAASLSLVFLVACEKGGETTKPDEVVAQPSDDGDEFDETNEELTPRGSIESGEEEFLTVSGFEQAVNDHMQDVVDCFSEAKAKNDKLGNKLIADFRIDGSGKVTSVAASGGSDIDDAGLLTCIRDRSQNWGLLAPPNGEPTNMTFPFDFTPA